MQIGQIRNTISLFAEDPEEIKLIFGAKAISLSEIGVDCLELGGNRNCYFLAKKEFYWVIINELMDTQKEFNIEFRVKGTEVLPIQKCHIVIPMPSVPREIQQDVEWHFEPPGDFSVKRWFSTFCETHL